MPISFAIADDNTVLLSTLARNLSVFTELSLLFTATNGQQAVDLARQQPPQVMLMDIDMPILDGIGATARLSELLPDTKILMLTIFDRDDIIFNAIKAGASGYLLKDEPPARLVAAIEEAVNEGAPMSPGVASRALALLRRQPFPERTPARQAAPPPQSYYLTSREIEILEQLSLGLSNQQIADKLFISDRTVRKHLENIYQKLHVHSKLEAVQLAGRHQWFNERQPG